MTHLKKGDAAPNFEVQDQKGKTIKLSDFKGKKLALYIYPKDMTPGCTAQACNITENYDQLESKGVAIVGVSADDASKHQKFIEKYELPFPLLADTETKLIKDYGCWGEKKFMGKVYDGIHRTTFLINEEGIIHDVIAKPKTKAHAEEILAGFGL